MALFERTLLAGLLIAIISGPIGCIVAWRRLAYFTDTVAHSSVFAIAVALLLGTAIYPTLIVFFFLFGFLLEYITTNNQALGKDATMIFLGNTLLALGIILNNFLPGQNLNLFGVLFGEILATTQKDLVYLSVMVTIILTLIAIFWQKLISFLANESLAQIEGINTFQIKLLLQVILIFFIAFALKLVGLLLLTAMLIIPAISARLISSSPFQMVMISTIIGCISVAVGIKLSFIYDLATGPMIVISNSCIFLLLKFLSIAKDGYN